MLNLIMGLRCKANEARGTLSQEPVGLGGGGIGKANSLGNLV